jgi:thiosulfate/3-mercaptopyruvate sulfurtransferase
MLIRVAIGLVFCLLLVSGTAQAAPVLVDSAWLDEHLQDSKLVIVDMTDDDLQYTRFHLPGAVRLAYHELLQPRRPGKPAARLDDAQFAALLGRLGIARDTHVVIYDDMGGLNAGRLFLELERIRHPEVSALDGGLVKWVLEGRRVDNIPHLRKPVQYQASGEQRANLATFAEVRRVSGPATPVLLDVRSRDEYTGTPKDARSGHIPGAQWWPWEQSINMESGFTFRETDKLEASLEKFGLNDRHAPVVLYCQSGHRASQSYLTLRRLGFDNVRVYTGSMLEYLSDKAAPLTRGPSPSL